MAGRPRKSTSSASSRHSQSSSATSSTSPKPLSVEGTPLKVNDHVFISPPWSSREGEPYLVARLMELYPSTERVRVAYFLRPRDISSRYSDSRLLIATMHTETVPVTYVRGVCLVKHKEEVDSLDEWKRRKDTFYWSQFYDRYTHRYLDSVSVDKIQNAPAHVVAHLVRSFEYILCEVGGMAAELCDAQRGCSTCHKWAATPESITCAHCTKVFHLACLDPPLSQKPKVGYSWACAPCSRKHDEAVEIWSEKGVAPTRASSGTAAAEDKKAIALAKGKGKEVRREGIRMTHGWPFRYFGMHTVPENVLDPHDSLYPRASIRLGNKFQAVVPDWDPVLQKQAEPVEQKLWFARKKAPASSKKAQDTVIDRGEDNAATKLISNADLTDSTLDKMVASAKKLPLHAQVGVDLIDRALFTGDPSLRDLGKVKAKDVGHAVWTTEETEKLREGARFHGNDIAEIATDLPGKKLKDVVKRYYMFAGQKVSEEVPQQPEDKAATASRKAAASDEDDTGSLCGAPVSAAAKKLRTCAVCETKSTSKWLKCPDALGHHPKKGVEHIMCESCGFRWRHYGIQYAPTQDELKALPVVKVKAGRKSESGSAKETTPKPIEPVREPTPPPPPPPEKIVLPPKPCVLCKRMDSKPTLAQCNRCTLSVHTTCYGITEDTELEDWLCELCTLDKRKERLPAPPRCILCPEQSLTASEKALTALDCLKLTEERNYVHVLCAAWHPEVKFDDPVTMSPAEAISLIPSRRRAQECFLCKAKDVGAYIKCEDCSKYFHVSCAWKAGYKFAFEIQPLKKKRAKEVASVKFKDEEGAMSACIWCPDHKFSQIDRITYDLGQRDSKSKLSALQTYVHGNKVSKVADSFALLRRARRLDGLIQSVLKPVQTEGPMHSVLEEADEAVDDEYHPEQLPPKKKKKAPPKHPKVPAPPSMQSAAPSRLSGTPSSLSALLNSREPSPIPIDHPFASPSPPLPSATLETPAIPSPPRKSPLSSVQSSIPLTSDLPGEIDNQESHSSDLTGPMLQERTREVVSAVPTMPLSSGVVAAASPEASPEMELGGAPATTTETLPPTTAALQVPAQYDQVISEQPKAPKKLNKSRSSSASSRTSASNPGPSDGDFPSQPRSRASSGSLVIKIRIPSRNPTPEAVPSLATTPILAPSPGATLSSQAQLQPDTLLASSSSIPEAPEEQAVKEGVYADPQNPEAARRLTAAGLKSESGSPLPLSLSESNNNTSTLPETLAGSDRVLTSNSPMTRALSAFEESVDTSDVETPQDPFERYALAAESMHNGIGDTAVDTDSDYVSEGDYLGSPAVATTALPCETVPPPATTTRPRRASEVLAPSVVTKGPQEPIVCSNCKTTDSPLFRRDAEGKQICNACGLFFKSHGHHRPSGLVARAIGPNRIAKRKAVDDGIPVSEESPTSKKGKTSAARMASSTMAPSPLGTAPPLVVALGSPTPTQAMPILSLPPESTVADRAPQQGSSDFWLLPSEPGSPSPYSISSPKDSFGLPTFASTDLTSPSHGGGSTIDGSQPFGFDSSVFFDSPRGGSPLHQSSTYPVDAAPGPGFAQTLDSSLVVASEAIGV